MGAKIHWVYQTHWRGKRAQNKVIGFVSTFGWESAEKKAESKYPGHVNMGVMEAQGPWLKAIAQTAKVFKK